MNSLAACDFCDSSGSASYSPRNPMTGPPLAPLGDERGRQPADVALDAEAVCFEFV